MGRPPSLGVRIANNRHNFTPLVYEIKINILLGATRVTLILFKLSFFLCLHVLLFFFFRVCSNVTPVGQLVVRFKNTDGKGQLLHKQELTDCYLGTITTGFNAMTYET